MSAALPVQSLEQIVRQLKPELIAIGIGIEPAPALTHAAARIPRDPGRELDIFHPQYVAPPPLREQQPVLRARLEHHRIATLDPAGKQPLVGKPEREEMLPVMDATLRVTVVPFAVFGGECG